MAGTVTVTRDPRRAPNEGKAIERISVRWTSDASGNADVSITNLYGFLVKFVTDPTDGPTDNYDFTLIDENGIDALAGTGVDRDTTTTEQVYPVALNAATPVFLCGTHTFTIANAGNAKSGVVVIYTIEAQ
jgi:hypothetical protein